VLTGTQGQRRPGVSEVVKPDAGQWVVGVPLVESDELAIDLRKWYGHRAERFDEFGDRYRAELAQSPAKEDVDELRHLAEDTGLVLLTATKDLALSHAIVLNDVIMSE